jgi:hypothetical protein
MGYAYSAALLAAAAIGVAELTEATGADAHALYRIRRLEDIPQADGCTRAADEIEAYLHRAAQRWWDRRA